MKIFKFLASETGANAAKWVANSLINDTHKALYHIKNLDNKDSLSTFERILLGLAVCDFSESIESFQNFVKVKDEILYSYLRQEVQPSTNKQKQEPVVQEAQKPKKNPAPTPVVGWIDPSYKFDWTGKGNKNESEDNVKPF